MGLNIKLAVILAEQGMKQKHLIQKLADIGISARPLTISNICNNKIKQLPTELIYGISVVTGTNPGDWITIEHPESEKSKN